MTMPHSTIVTTRMRRNRPRSFLTLLIIAVYSALSSSGPPSCTEAGMRSGKSLLMVARPFKMFSESLLGDVQSRPDRSDRAANHLRDVRVRHFLEEPENQNLSVLRLEKPQGLVNQHGVKTLDRSVFAFMLQKLVVLCQLKVGRSSNRVVHFVSRDGVQPGDKGLRLSECYDLAVHSYPYLLENIVRCIRRADQLANEIPQAAVVGAHQSLKRTLIAKLTTENQCAFSQSFQVVLPHAISLVPASLRKFSQTYPFSR